MSRYGRKRKKMKAQLNRPGYLIPIMRFTISLNSKTYMVNVRQEEFANDRGSIDKLTKINLQMSIRQIRLRLNTRFTIDLKCLAIASIHKDIYLMRSLLSRQKPAFASQWCLGQHRSLVIKFMVNRDSRLWIWI